MTTTKTTRWLVQVRPRGWLAVGGWETVARTRRTARLDTLMGRVAREYDTDQVSAIREGDPEICRHIM